MKLQWTLLYLLAPLACCRYAVFIDPACGAEEVETIKTAVRAAYARAERGVSFFDGNLQPTDRDLEETVTQLLEQRQEKRETVRNILNNVQAMQNDELFVLGEPNAPRPDVSDVVIHCDLTRLDNNQATANTLFDPTQRSHISRNGLANSDSCRQGRNEFTGGMLTRALVMQPSPLGDDEHSMDYDDYDYVTGQAEVIQLCASTMEDIRDAAKNHGLLYRERIESVVVDARNSESSTDETKGIDLLTTVEHVFLHELTHLIRNGRTIDGSDEDEEQCYGWVSAGRCKNPNHADTVAFVGLMADLRYNDAWRPGYSTRPKGSVVPILSAVPGGGQPPPEQPANPDDLPA
ncbi:hypothetical protein V8F20_004181 [Naviculisporaceae sp. PSN 640]